MNCKQAQAMVERQARAWEKFDVEAILATFAEDGVLIAPGGRWQGHAAIRAAAEAFFAGVTKVEVTITRVFSQDDRGAAEWRWCETRLADGAQHIAEDAIIFVVRGEKIIYWREYFDTATF